MFLVLWLQQTSLASLLTITFIYICITLLVCVGYNVPGGCVYTGEKRLESNPPPFK